MTRHSFLVVLVSGLVWAGDPPAPAATAIVERGQLSKTITLSGELEAVERLSVTVPNISRIRNLVISFLAPEGRHVQTGETVVQFDVSELEARRLELEQEREDARIKIAQTKTDIESRRQDLLMAVATARKTVEVAALYVGIDRQLIPASDAEKYEYDYSKGQVELEKAHDRSRTLAETETAEMQVVQLEFEKAELEMKRIESELERLTVQAPSPGLLLYGDNPTRAGKVQVGDSLWSGWPVASLPNMEALMIEAYAYDSDLPWLALGQTAEIYLDSAPTRRFTGVIRSIAESARSREFRSQLKAFLVRVVLNEVDSSLMKPGMTARALIRVARPEALLVPREAVFTDGAGASWVYRSGQTSPVPVKIIDAGTRLVAVEGDLSPGEAVALGVSRGTGRGSESQTDWLKIERDDYRFFVPGSGTLEASRQASIGPPPIPNLWRFKIVGLAVEGDAVEPGDMLVSFDPSETQKQLRDEEANLDKLIEELEKTRASEELKSKDLEIQLEEARVQDEKARNKLIEAREFSSNLKVREAEYEAAFQAERVQLLAKKLEFVLESTRLQLKLLEDRKALRERRIQRYRKALEDLTVLATMSGVVIYETNWRNEKKQIGSDVFRMEKILSIPDLRSLVVKGQIAEVDAGRVKAGQTVVISLDALPDRTFRGVISEVGTIFRRASFDRPVKVLDVVIELDEIDLTSMRPGMVAKLEIVTHQFDDALAVPLAAVATEEEENFVWVKTDRGTEKRQVSLGENNGLVAVVSEGLVAGEEIASRPPGATQ